jgi:hypothetical protein
MRALSPKRAQFSQWSTFGGLTKLKGGQTLGAYIQ